MTETITPIAYPSLTLSQIWDQKSDTCGLFSHAFQAGELCPSCGQGKLDYDGCLNLVCPQCGCFAGGGSFT